MICNKNDLEKKAKKGKHSISYFQTFELQSTCLCRLFVGVKWPNNKANQTNSKKVKPEW